MPLSFRPVLLMSVLLAAAAALGAAPAGKGAPVPERTVALVFVAPNYPGTTEEAQPRMDALARALAAGAGWPEDRLSASYYPQEKPGLARVADGGVAVVLAPLPFFLAHREALSLTPRLAVEQQGLQATQAWALVAARGKVKGPQDLAGATVFSPAGYAPRFVTHVALGDWGPLPGSVKVTSGAGVLSALRKVAKGDGQAALLDEEQTRALSSLPFAGELEVVQAGPRLPVAVVATVDGALTGPQWAALEAAFRTLSAKGKEALEGVRLTGFAPLDGKAIRSGQERFGAAR